MARLLCFPLAEKTHDSLLPALLTLDPESHDAVETGASGLPLTEHDGVLLHRCRSGIPEKSRKQEDDPVPDTLRAVSISTSGKTLSGCVRCRHPATLPGVGSDKKQTGLQEEE